MSQKLCEKCLKSFSRGIYGNADAKENYPWIHCHHEEEKKGCDKCTERADWPADQAIVWSYSTHPGFMRPANFCPNCGRRL